jgi:hypothetical protein
MFFLIPKEFEALTNTLFRRLGKKCWLIFLVSAFWIHLRDGEIIFLLDCKNAVEWNENVLETANSVFLRKMSLLEWKNFHQSMNYFSPSFARALLLGLIKLLNISAADCVIKKYFFSWSFYVLFMIFFFSIFDFLPSLLT